MGRRILTGIQPSGILHIGNYFGAMKASIELQNQNPGDTYLFIADLHSLTVNPKPEDLRMRIRRLALDYLACGLDPEKTAFFRQSDIQGVCELTWILNTITGLGLLERAHSYKDKIAKGFIPNNGLFSYPVLMAADILLYQTDVVPVGIDQKQHVEICRDIANRFNQIYPDTFTVPEPIIARHGMKIMSLAEPTKKMSKSDENENAVVRILDDRDTIIRKFRRAVTDSDAVVRYAEGKDGINNLMTIYAALTGKDMAEIEREFDGRGYGDFKTAVGETCADVLAPVQERFKTYIADKAMLEAQMKKGAAEASYVARRTLSKVQKKLGFVQLH